MKSRWNIISLIWLIIMCEPAIGQNIPECLDEQGNVIEMVIDFDVDAAGMAAKNSSGNRIIVINPEAFEGTDVAYHIFVYLHECAHHVLGHVESYGISLSYDRQAEIDADCWAIRVGISGGYILRDDIETILDTVRLNPGTYYHKIGPAAASDLIECLEE